jgi:FkbM family methyltransferase
MINYDFVEIGTSDFDTLIEHAADETVGLSIEPLKFYLDNLPNRKNVQKLNFAISIDGTTEDTKIYYIPPNVIKEQQFSDYLRGCNKINSPHSCHSNKYFEDKTTMDYVVCDTVKQITIAELYNQYNIQTIKLLKIDTEGYDCQILAQLLLFLKTKSSIFYPRKIIFESNVLNDLNIIVQTINDYKDIGYKLQSLVYNDKDANTILVYDEEIL